LRVAMIDGKMQDDATWKQAKVIVDLATLVAGLLGRGRPLVLVPTTLLAQVDASVGGKGAVDLAGIKNPVGLIRSADDVIVDLDFLTSLDLDAPRRGTRRALQDRSLIGSDRSGGLTRPHLHREHCVGRTKEGRDRRSRSVRGRRAPPLEPRTHVGTRSGSRIARRVATWVCRRDRARVHRALLCRSRAPAHGRQRPHPPGLAGAGPPVRYPGRLLSGRADPTSGGQEGDRGRDRDDHIEGHRAARALALPLERARRIARAFGGENMNRWMVMSLMASMVSACENPDTGLVFEKYVAPDDDCSVDPNAAPTSGPVFDPAFQGDLTIFPVLRNDLNPPEVVVNIQTGSRFTPEASLLVTEFEYSFQCDESVFAGAPRLFLPLFGPIDAAFCQDPRDSDGLFLGFDVRPVDTPRIDPGDTQATAVTIISPELARGLEDMFRIGVAAELCCNDPARATLCEQGQIDQLPSTVVACADLKEAFQVLNFPLSELDTLRRYARFDVSVGDAYIGGPYLLRVIGSYIGVSSSGRTLTSNEASSLIRLNGNIIRRTFERSTLEDRIAIIESVQCVSEPLFQPN
ncbi:MAG: hypothetical protein HC923_09785, partial [Myxococcales bacterium]|nr:hypothetical protein [Myxococcales bacterium]